MEFLKLFQEFENANLRYLVVGGIAVNLYGIERPTKDIDLIVYLERKNLLNFIKVITRLGFIPKLPVKAEDFTDPQKRTDWIKTKNMLVFSFYHRKDSMNVIDVFVKHPLPFGSIYKRRERIRLGRFSIPVIGIPDLIKLKQKAHRLQDQADIRALKEILRIRKERKRETKK